MSRKLSIILLIFIAVVTFGIPSATYAAKKFVPKKVTRAKVSAGSIPAIVRYRGDRQGILLSFLNFNGLKSASYSFTYETNGNPQGAGGTITAANNPTAQRELLFGTCSSGVCRYHYNLTNARLILTAKTTNGRTISKSYRIKTYQ
ncbi:hypothetical protein HY945_03125 [Candidatus Gottesmanbacteria bacterium]|nr:hypothetical protein [Candidatus Gottesmanbacteria bacterium]